MKVAPLIAMALILFIAFPGPIQAKKFCIGKDGNRYEVGQWYDDKEGETCIHYVCIKKKKKLIMKEKGKCKVPEPNLAANMAAIEASIKILNASMESMEDKFEVLKSSVESILEIMTAVESKSKNLGTCMGDLSSSDCPNSTPGKIGVVDGISNNAAGLVSNKATITSNTAHINTNTDTYSSIQTTTTELKTCLSDVNSCPSSNDGKTSVSDAIMKNEDSIHKLVATNLAKLAGTWSTTYTNGAKATFTIKPDGEIILSGRNTVLEPSDDQVNFPSSEGWMKGDKLWADTAWSYYRLAQDGTLKVEHFNTAGNSNYCCSGIGHRQG